MYWFLKGIADPLCIILLINLSIGFTICSRRVIDIFQGNARDSLYVVKKWHKFVLLIQKRVFFFLWPLSIKNNIVLYHMDSAPLYHVDFPQLHLIGFHDIYYIAWSSGSYVSPTCPFLAGALTKTLNWKVSSSTLGSSLCPTQCRRGGRKTASSWLLFIQFITFL